MNKNRSSKHHVPLKFQQDLYVLDNLICHAKSVVLGYANDRAIQLEYATSCIKTEVTKYYRLATYIEILENAKRALLQEFKDCLDTFKLQRIIEAVRNILPPNCDRTICSHQFVRDLEADEWVVANPYCAGHQEWERLNYIICDDIQIDLEITPIVCTNSVVFSIEKINCDASLSMSVREVKTCEMSLLLKVEPKLCRLLPFLQVYQKACDLKLKMKISRKECDIHFKTLIKRFNCDLSLSHYVTLIECNLSPKFIAKVYECGLSFTVNVQKKECAIKLSHQSLKLGTNEDLGLTFKLGDTPNCETLNQLYNANINCSEVEQDGAAILKDYQ